MIRDISIVIPIYNEQDNIIQLIREVRDTLEKKINYEIFIQLIFTKIGNFLLHSSISYFNCINSHSIDCLKLG